MHIRRDRKLLDGDRPRTYVSLVHNVWSMGRNGKKQSRPVVFARLGVEDNLDPELVRGMRNALDQLLDQLLARNAASSATAPDPADTPSSPPEVVEALAPKVRAHEAGLRMLTSRDLGVRRVVEAVWAGWGWTTCCAGSPASTGSRSTSSASCSPWC